MARVRIGDRKHRGSGTARAVQVDLELVTGEPVSGFRDVPLGPHRFSVRSEAGWRHEWCHVAGDDDVVVVAGDDDVVVVAGDDDVVVVARDDDVVVPTGRDGPGAGTVRLAPFPTGRHEQWAALTANLRRHWDERGASDGNGGAGGSGSDRAGSLLADLEQSFLDGYLTPDTGDLAAMSRWRRLVATLAGARTGDISRSPDLYVRSVEALQAQFELLGSDPLDDGLRYELDFLAVELVRADDPTLGLAGITLERMLHR